MSPADLILMPNPAASTDGLSVYWLLQTYGEAVLHSMARSMTIQIQAFARIVRYKA